MATNSSCRILVWVSAGPLIEEIGSDIGLIDEGVAFSSSSSSPRIDVASILWRAPGFLSRRDLIGYLSTKSTPHHTIEDEDDDEDEKQRAHANMPIRAHPETETLF